MAPQRTATLLLAALLAGAVPPAAAAPDPQQEQIAELERTGVQDARLAQHLLQLGTRYSAQDRPAEAAPLLRRALALSTQLFGPAHPAVADCTLALGRMLYRSQDPGAEAEPLLRQAISIRERHPGDGQAQLGAALSEYGDFLETKGRYPEAERQYQRVLALIEASALPDQRRLASALQRLGSIADYLGRPAEAEALFIRALRLLEGTEGAQSSLAGVLYSMAFTFKQQRRFAEAIPLFHRALALRTALGDADSQDIVMTKNALAQALTGKGQADLSLPLLQDVVAARERRLGAGHIAVGTALLNLAEAHITLRDFVKAAPLVERALTLLKATLGEDHPYVSWARTDLSFIESKRGNADLAEQLALQVAASRARTLGADHADVAAAWNGLAVFSANRGKLQEALAYARKSTAIIARRVAAAGAGEFATREAARSPAALANHLNLLARNAATLSPEQLIEESLALVQLHQTSGTSGAIGKMTGRLASGNGKLATLLRQQQDSLARRTRAEGKLLAVAASNDPPAGDSERQHARAELDDAVRALAESSREIRQRYPAYDALNQPPSLPESAIRATLREGEAMLVFAVTPIATFRWIIKSSGAQFVALPLTEEKVRKLVASVRAQMTVDAGGAPVPVDLAALHALHQHLLGGTDGAMAGVRHLVVVPSGALQSLPFGMLVVSPPLPGAEHDYRGADWLVQHRALSVMPSIGALQALRASAQPARSGQTFAGFGDPLLLGPSMAQRGKRAVPAATAVFAMTPGAVRGDGPAIADPEALRKASPLPETADELRAMAAALGAPATSVYLAERASETRIKGMDLSEVRIIAFATHGLMAGELRGVGEPGLVLTPPPQATATDDGFLTASEVALLRLNADLVILSACNTAAPDGTPGAEGLSGLAKAFFFAGARSLLVSHWPVVSEATVPLTTTMLREVAVNTTEGKAESLRRAMRAMLASSAHPEYAHPLFWAPFVLAGEAGTH